MPQQRTKVFVSYSHKDSAFLARLRIHLQPLIGQGLIDYWDDITIRPGQLWHDDIMQALATTKVAVLLVSADFLSPTDKTTFERLRPGHVGSHEGEGGINVARVEGCIRCA